MAELLEVSNLSVGFHTPEGKVQAVRGVSFSLKRGEVLAIVGESGCGKSVLCRSIMKMLPSNAEISAEHILFDGKDISGYSERDMQRLRGKVFSMVFQNPMTSLNPTMTIGAQIAEAVRAHEPKLSKKELLERVTALMEMVGIEHAGERMNLYPYHFSGGMRQRSVLAAALAQNPDILIADEPTTALDVTIQAQILQLIRDIQKKLGMAVIFVTHDLGVVARIADRVAVMYAGKIVETGTAEEIFYDARHPYTQALLRAHPSLAKGKERLCAISGMPPDLTAPPKGDAFACRNEYALAIDYEEEPPMFPVSETHAAATWLLDKRAEKAAEQIKEKQQGTKSGLTDEQAERKEAAQSRQETSAGADKREVLVDIQHLTQIFPLTKKIRLKAVDDLSLQIYRGEVFGLVGESGSGKSTAARCIMNLYKPAQGNIFYKGINTCEKKAYRENKRLLQSSRQMIFQDSDSSLNQRMKVKDIIAEPLRIQHRTPLRGTMRAEAAFQMKYVGLDESCLEKYPSQLSGGERQRVAIARALAMEPELLVADEPIASLDVSIQAQIVNLFKHLQKEHGFTFLFIAHDLAMVEFLCDRVGVMYNGKLVEVAPVKELFEHPRHPYTKSLLASVLTPDPRKERERK